MNHQRIFRQFFDKTSSTYTYLLADLTEKMAILIDACQDCVQRELKTIDELRIKKIYLLSTHIHADHITGNALLKRQLGPSRSTSLISKYYQNARADAQIGEDETLSVGCFNLSFIHTPGHTSGCLCIVDHENRRVFTGDTLLVRGCGRTDFQGGSSEQLYDSVRGKLFKLPRDYTVYPAHDYTGATATSIGEEIDLNPRLSKSRDQFVEIMSSLNLAYPKLIDVAVPRNLNCGYEGEFENANENGRQQATGGNGNGQ